METGSDMFVNNGAVVETENSFHSPVLLKTTSYARLFRLSRGGRYFVIKTTKDNSARQRELLRREYELSLGCEHPHIVNVLFFEYNTPVGDGVIMQYVDGCTLREFLATNPATTEKQRLFAELLSAVGCLHKRGVVHNDLKPENILVTNNGHSLKLIDFGLASDDAHYLLKTPGCTYAYAAPELRTGNGEVSVRSDIYSLGIIMKELLGNSSIAKRCMNVLPRKRYANIESLQKAWSRRNRKYYILAVFVGLLLLLLPPLHYIGEEKRADDKERIQNELMVRVEHDVDSICTRALDEASRLPFREFVYACPAKIQRECSEYMDMLLSTVDDPNLRAVLSTHYGVLFKKHWLDIVDFVNNVKQPSFYDLPVEQMLYYDSLFTRQLPYAPFPDI